MANRLGLGLDIAGFLLIFFVICTRIGKVGYQPLKDLQDFFRLWRASWITFCKAVIAFKVEWQNQWEESWRRAGL